MFVGPSDLYLIWYCNVPSMSIIQQRIQKALAFLKISLYWKYPLPRQGCSDPLQSTIWGERFALSVWKMTLQATNASLAIRFCWRAFNQDNRAEAKGERWEWRHRRRSFAPTILFQPWQQLLILPGLWCVWSGIKPENQKNTMEVTNQQ